KLLFNVLCIFPERLVVTGEDRPVFAYAGQEVVLSCSVDSHVLPEQVTWNKHDSGRESVLVLLFEDNNTWPDSSHERYQGRAELFPAEIHKGNFSLRLKDVRTEDKGKYVCQVHTSYRSANTTAELQLWVNYGNITRPMILIIVYHVGDKDSLFSIPDIVLNLFTRICCSYNVNLFPLPQVRVSGS
uniref:Ig-like domain-containing protein n=1 Tax=Denticeps clupeoides TaxID=299321 RepID=A0AAY4DEB4_9TELE